MKNNDRAEVLGVVGDEGVQEEKRRAGGFPEVRLTYIDAVRKKLACCHRVRVPRRFVTLLARSYDSSRALRFTSGRNVREQTRATRPIRARAKSEKMKLALERDTQRRRVSDSSTGCNRAGRRRGHRGYIAPTYGKIYGIFVQSIAHEQAVQSITHRPLTR